jgi:hypothetical protein
MDHREAKSFKQLTISVEKLPALAEEQAKRTEYAAERARILLGCYRTGDANDPDTYVAAIAATLARYPEKIMDIVTDPRIGLPRKKTWLPSIKEVYDACEEEERPIREEEVRRANIRAMLEDRKKDPARENRPTREQLKAKYGENWGLGSLDEPKRKAAPAPTKEELAAHYRQYGLAFKPKHHEGAEIGTHEENTL